jgi:hypothetical protein
MQTCTLRVIDQVNIKFEGLDPATRKELVKKLSFMNPKARHMPSFKLGRWDGKVPFATIGGGTYYNLLETAANIVLNAGYEIDIDDQRPVWGIEFDDLDKTYLSDTLWPEGHPLQGQPIVLNDHQVEAINRYLNPNQYGNRHSIQSISTSAGKAQPLTSKILTPNGWKQMGEIEVGNQVISADGSVAKVVGIFPQGKKRMFRVTFADGRTAEACPEHLWKAHKASWHLAAKHSYSDWDIVDTTELARLLTKKTNRNRISVPLYKPDFKAADHELPIEPYILGALIGDGGLRHCVMLSSADSELIRHFNALVGPEYRLVHRAGCDYYLGLADHTSERSKQGQNDHGPWHHYVAELTQMGLMGCYSHEKFVPNLYLNASPRQRLELVRGLMDTDGTVGKNGETNFSTSSPRLAKDMVTLIRSLGGWATIANKQSHYTHNGLKQAGRPSFTVRIRHPRPADLFRLSRKRNATRATHRFALRLPITKIEEIESVEAQCIMIDHPDHLYVTDDYVVTHNTIITACLSKKAEKYGRTLVIVPGKDLVTQTLEDYANVGLDTGIYFSDFKMTDNRHIISTWQSLTRMHKDESENFYKITKDVVAVIVDEAHTITGAELKNMLCGPLAHVPLRWALTGTIPKEPHEFNALLCAIGPKVGEIRADELQEKGILSNCDIDIMQLVDEVSFKAWDQEIDYLTTDKERVQWIAEEIKRINLSGNTLVLVSRVPMGKTLSELIGAPFIYGNVASKKRKEEYKSINTTDNKIIVATFGVASTGINIPRIFNLVLIEPGKSFVRVIQSIGRGLRRAADKDFVQIYDICSTAKFSKRHLTQRKSDYSEAGYPHKVRKITYRK